MSPFRMTVDASSAEEALARFQWASAASQASDRIRPAVMGALRARTPYGKGSGRHMRDTLAAERHTTTTTMQLMFGYRVSWAKYVLGGTKAHTITPKAARALHWVADGGESRFAMSAHIPAIPANRFPEKAWEDVREIALREFRVAMEEAFHE